MPRGDELLVVTDAVREKYHAGFGSMNDALNGGDGGAGSTQLEECTAVVQENPIGTQAGPVELSNRMSYARGTNV